MKPINQYLSLSDIIGIFIFFKGESRLLTNLSALFDEKQNSDKKKYTENIKENSFEFLFLARQSH